jgi:hypothetical protein
LFDQSGVAQGGFAHHLANAKLGIFFRQQPVFEQAACIGLFCFAESFWPGSYATAAESTVV